jgi:hypothetical protein
MKWKCSLFLLGLGLLPSSGIAQDHASVEWTNESVVGLCLSLEDPIVYEELDFRKDGYLLATFGTKGGPYTGPLLRWKLVKGRLQIGEGEAAEQFTLVSRDVATVVVKTRSGKILRFKVVVR